MRNAYIEVLRSYWGKADSSWNNGIWVVGGLCMMVGSFGMGAHAVFLDSTRSPSTFIMGLTFVGMFLWNHFRDLAVNPARRLSPGSVAPNLSTFAALSSILIILWPAMLSPTLTQALAIIALATAWFAVFGFLTLTMSMILSVLSMIPYLWFSFGPLSGNMRAFLGGNEPGLATGIIAVSVVVIAIEAICMIRMTEDNPRFSSRWQLDTWSLKPRMTGEVNRVWSETRKSQPLGWPSLGTSVFIPTKSTVWQRARRWRTLTSGLLKGPVLVMGMLVVSFLLPWRGNPIHPSQWLSPSLFFAAALLNVVPLVSVSQMWLNQWRFLETELLRPMDRGGFLRDLGLAVAIDMVRCWAVSAAALCVLLIVMFGTSIDRTGLVFGTLASGFLLVVEYGAVICLMSCRSPTFNIFGCLGMMIFVIPIIMCSFAPNLGPYRAIALAVALVLAVLGIFVIQSAHRTWMETELG
jgi:hypothetical protein